MRHPDVPWDNVTSTAGNEQASKETLQQDSQAFKNFELYAGHFVRLLFQLDSVKMVDTYESYFDYYTLKTASPANHQNQWLTP